MAIFTIPIAIRIDAENQCLINHPDSYRDICGALNRHFLGGAVMGWRSCLSWSVYPLFTVSWCVGLMAVLDFFALVCAFAKNTNVSPTTK